MVNQTGFFAVGDGGLVIPHGDNIRCFGNAVKCSDGVWRHKDDPAIERLNKTGEAKPPKQVLVEKPKQDESWRKKAKAMVEKAKAEYPSAVESALEKELWNQVSAKPSAQSTVDSRLAAEYAALQAQQNRESSLCRKLFDQIRSVR